MKATGLPLQSSVMQWVVGSLINLTCINRLLYRQIRSFLVAAAMALVEVLPAHGNQARVNQIHRAVQAAVRIVRLAIQVRQGLISAASYCDALLRLLPTYQHLLPQIHIR